METTYIGTLYKFRPTLPFILPESIWKTSRAIQRFKGSDTGIRGAPLPPPPPLQG